MPQFLLQQVEGFEPERRTAILGGVSTEALDAIRAKLAIGWLDMTPHMEFMGQLEGTVGPDAYEDLWTEAGRNFMERPIAGGLLGMAKRLFCKKPREAVRFLPRMYALGVEGLGEVSVEDLSENVFSVTLHHFPADRWDFDNFVIGLAGATRGACAVMFPDWPMEIGFETPDHETGAADFRLVLGPDSGDVSA